MGSQVNPDRQNAVVAHGTIMGLAFGALFPLGAILVRTASFRGLDICFSPIGNANRKTCQWVHTGIQVFAYILALAGLGLGVYIAVYPDSQLTASNGHPIIGIIVIGSLAFQPIGGLIQHYIYKKHQRRTTWGTTHIWWGRVLLTAGIINGGLGLMLNGDTVKGEIAYGVVAGTMWLVWVAAVVLSRVRSKGTSSQRETGEKAWGQSHPAFSPDRLMKQTT